MAVSSQPALFEALGSASHQLIVGTTEADWIDFKSEPYRVDAARGVRDLVADVASFANGRGGVIAIGVATERGQSSSVEVATVVRGTRPELVDDARYRMLIDAHVHPRVAIDIRRYEVGEAGRVLVLIVVPPPVPADAPYIIDRAIVDGEREVAHAFAWPTRSGDGTYWESAARVQQLISAGRRAADQPAPEIDNSGLWAIADAQLAIADQEEGWLDWPNLAVQAIPIVPSSTISDFYGAFAEAVRGWRGLRRAGFELGLGYGGARHQDSSLVFVPDGRRFVAVHRSGVITAAATGTPDMLGWSLNDRQGWESIDEVIANPYVVVEYSTEAVRFIEDCVGPHLAPDAWKFRVVGSRLLAPRKLILQPHPGTFGSFDQTLAINPEFSDVVDGEGDVGGDAFAVVAAIYGSGFGLGLDSVPFAVERRIDLGLMDRR